MPPENNYPGSAEEWMRHARSDLELARTEPPPFVLLEAFCFHAQQAAEKALKAIFISRCILVPKTHNIGTLLDIIEDHVTVPEKIRESAILTDYAVITRYPGASEPVEEAEFNEAIRLAQTVVSWAKEIIGQ